MKKIISIIFLITLLAGCTTYDGAAYIKADLEKMECSNNPAQDIKTACINGIIDEEFFKAGASIMTVDTLRSVDRYGYADCMKKKGFICSWGASDPGKK
jgi:PBP1b-binding outer membrane lipoprotein LpoB